MRESDVEGSETWACDARRLHIGVHLRRSDTLEGAVGGRVRGCGRRPDGEGRWTSLDANVDLIVLSPTVSYV